MYSFSITTFVLTDSLGIVKSTTSDCGFICKFFKQQTFTIPKNTYTVGEEVKITSSIACFRTIGYVTIQVDIEGPITKGVHLNTNANTAGKLVTNTITFSAPSTPGTYTIKHSWYCQEEGPFPDAPQTITVVNKITSCAQDSLIGAEDTTNTKGEGVDAYQCMRWQRETLSNGNCIPSTYCKYYVTYCKAGYVVEGTNSRLSNEGIKRCVVPQDTTTPLVTLCDTDATQSCADGSTIVLQKCNPTSGLQDTGETCGGGVPIIDDNNMPPAGTVDSSWTLDKKKQYCADNGYDGIDLQTNTCRRRSTESSTNWIMVGGIGFIVILFIIVSVLTFKRMRK